MASTVEITGSALRLAAAGRDRTALRASIRRTQIRAGGHLRDRSPVLTGTYQRSFQASRVRLTATGAEGEVFNTDTPGKVRVIEFGFLPARPDLRGRQGRFVFGGATDLTRRTLDAEARTLSVEMVAHLEARTR